MSIKTAIAQGKKPYKCKACGRRFSTPEARIQHKADTGHTNNPKSAKQPEIHYSDNFLDALDLYDDLGLSEGAAMAAAFEISGDPY